MFSSGSFNTLLGLGNAGEPLRLNRRTLDALGIDPAPAVRLGLLREEDVGTFVECFWCGACAAVRARVGDDGTALFADCPECGLYELPEAEQKLWRLDFTPLLDTARSQLRCSGSLAELVPDARWSLGRAALAGQSREVFACAGINGIRNAEIIKHLATGKTPLLLVLGNAPRPEKLGAFSPDRVFLFSDLARLEDGEIHFDVSIIQNQLGTLSALEEPTPKANGKNSKIGDLIIKLKEELRQYMRGVYSAAMQAERNNRVYDFPELKQSDLARMLGVERVYVKRAIDSDLELKTLFTSANNRNSMLAYGHKARF